MKGFALIEGLISVMITLIMALSVAGLLLYFMMHNRSNVELTCLVNTANSAIEACRGGIVPPNQFTCGGRNITVNFTGSCTGIGNNQCQTITVVASDGVRNLRLQDVVCNLQ